MAERINRELKVTTIEAAAAAKVHPNVIRTWRNRGWRNPAGELIRLSVVGHIRGGRVLHRLGDVLDAERDTACSGKSHRHLVPSSLIAA